MALVWWGAGEEIEFPVRYSTTVTDSATSAARRSIVRAALKGNLALALGTVLADSKPLATPLTSCWFSFRIYKSSYVINVPEVGLGGSAALGGLFIGTGAVQGKLSLFSITSAGT